MAPEEACGEPIHQFSGILVAGALGPFHEGFLCGGQRVLDAVETKAL